MGGETRRVELSASISSEKFRCSAEGNEMGDDGIGRMEKDSRVVRFGSVCRQRFIFIGQYQSILLHTNTTGVDLPQRAFRTAPFQEHTELMRRRHSFEDSSPIIVYWGYIPFVCIGIRFVYVENFSDRSIGGVCRSSELFSHSTVCLCVFISPRMPSHPHSIGRARWGFHFSAAAAPEVST